jgi:hypothetical protein
VMMSNMLGPTLSLIRQHHESNMGRRG